MLLRAYKRAFSGIRERWEGKSVGTLIKTEDGGDYVEGLAVQVTLSELATLDPWESYPEVYTRISVDLEDVSTDPATMLNG